MNTYDREERIRELATTTPLSRADAEAQVAAELALAEASQRGAELDDTVIVLVPNRAERRRAARDAKRS
ncbi:hypothetical protein ACYX8G_19555 [Microbacterium saperdae]